MSAARDVHEVRDTIEPLRLVRIFACVDVEENGGKEHGLAR
jgi:ribosomal protein L30/L7E